MKTKLTTIMLIAGFLCAEAQTWTWSEDYLPYGRTGLSATVMDDSIFYSGGKIYNYAFSNIIDIYDIGEDEWDTYEPQTPGRWQTMAVSANGMVFFAGGCDYNPNIPWDWYAEIDVFTKATGEWTIEYLSEARMMMGTVAHGNIVFFAGGVNGVGTASYHDVIDIYDTETKSWSTKYLSVPRGLIGAAAAGSKVFFAGGTTSLNEVTDVVDIYDVENDLWSVEYLSEPRASTAAITYGDKVYFAGGALPNNNTSIVIDIYNVADSSWEDSETLSTPRIVTALNVYNALVFTGHVDYIDLDEFIWHNENGIVDIYYPETGNWGPTVPELNPPKHFYAHFAYDNKAYYAGGWPNSPAPTDIISILDFGTGISNNKSQESAVRVYPNPFTSTMRVNYNLQQPGKVSIAIYNNIGEKVEVLLNEYNQEGDQQVIFNSEKLKPGIYFCTLKTDEGIQSTKMIKL